MIPRTAIVLAGGMGTRLQSVVSDVPKPLAPIGDQPFLAYLLDHLAEAGITRAILATGHLGDLVEARFGESYKSIALTYSRETEPLGTGGAVRLALKHVTNDQQVLIVNGDTYFGCDLGAFAKTHVAYAADVSLALYEADDASRYGLVELDEGGRVVAFREKTPGAAGFINAGVYLLRPSALQSVSLPTRFSLERDFFETHLATLRIYGVPLAGYFIDIGIPEDYRRTQAYFSR